MHENKAYSDKVTTKTEIDQDGKESIQMPKMTASLFTIDIVLVYNVSLTCTLSENG